MAKDIVAGLVYIRRRSLVLVLLVMGLATTLFANPFRFIMPVFIVDIYHRDADAMGLMMAVMGAGTLVGALFVASLGRWRRGLLLMAGGFLSGVALLLVASVAVYYAGVAIMLLLGLGDAGRRTLNQSLIMERVEDQFRGRVMSVFMMEHGLMPLGVVPLGIAVQVVGGQVAVGILSVLLLATVSVIYITRKDLRNLS